MGQQQSKGELLYQQVSYGSIDGIKLLHRDGVDLEWMDREGKTSLILACMRHEYLHVAKTLIELGANVNVYRPGSHAGTPLHHAAKRGLEHTVKLLLSHGANALVINDDCQTPLDVARGKGHIGVVRAIEDHICLFSGWLRELYGPGFMEALVPQWVSRKVWAVVIPRDSRNPNKRQKFELAIYPALQVAQPRTVIFLWNADMEEVKFNQSDPTLVITDNATKTRFKLLSENVGDRQQIQWFYNACRGMHQPSIPSAVIPATAPTASPEDVDQLAMAIDASSNPGSQSGPSHPLKTNNNGGLAETASSSSTYDGWGGPEAGFSGDPTQLHQSQLSKPVVPAPTQSIPPAVPSAPSIPDISDDDGPIQYPSIDSSPVDISMPTVEITSATSVLIESGDASASCVICLDAPKEGACVPCGHVVGCMNCLNDIKAKNWGCPVCRAKINQVIKLYTV